MDITLHKSHQVCCRFEPSCICPAWPHLQKSDCLCTDQHYLWSHIRLCIPTALITSALSSGGILQQQTVVHCCCKKAIHVYPMTHSECCCCDNHLVQHPVIKSRLSFICVTSTHKHRPHMLYRLVMLGLLWRWCQKFHISSRQNTQNLVDLLGCSKWRCWLSQRWSFQRLHPSSTLLQSTSSTTLAPLVLFLAATSASQAMWPASRTTTLWLSCKSNAWCVKRCLIVTQKQCLVLSCMSHLRSRQCGLWAQLPLCDFHVRAMLDAFFTLVIGV